MQIKEKKLDDLIQYAGNAKEHPEEQVAQIAASIKEFGFNQPILIDSENVIIAGHGRLKAAQKLKLETVPTIQLGHLSEAQKKAYIIADNKLTLSTGFNMEVLEAEIERLKELDFDLDLTGFDMSELEELESEIIGGTSVEYDDTYSKKIKAPIYEPKEEEKPSLSELFDFAKTEKLIEKINNSNASKDDKDFLIKAAQRHTVLNFEKIAEYYCHSDKYVQELMEESALVVIDFDKAIENEYVILNDKIKEQYVIDNEGE